MPRDGSRLDKRLFTVNERVLLHLKESGSTSHSIDLPAPMTQEGIAGALGILVNHVSRAVKSLEQQGFVREATARVKGDIRKRKIYLITEDGMAVANNVTRRIGEAVVSVRDSRQRLREMPANEAKHLLLPPRTFTAMLASLDEKGILDVYKAKAKQKKTAAVARFYGGPPEAAFYGRAEDLKRMRAWLQARKPPVMVVTGYRGIGKTALAMQFVKSLEGKMPTFWYTFSAGSTTKQILHALSGFLNELGRTEVALLEDKDLDEVRSRLEACFESLDAIFVFDGVSQENENMADALKAIIEMASATGNRVLITSREHPRWRRELKSRGIMDETQLHGLDRESCRSLAPQLDEREFAKLFTLTRGNPLEIKMLSEHAEDEKDIEELTPEERALVRYLRVVHEE